MTALTSCSLPSNYQNLPKVGYDIVVFNGNVLGHAWHTWCKNGTNRKRMICSLLGCHMQIFILIYFRTMGLWIWITFFIRTVYYTINAVSFYYLWYGTMYKRQYTDKTLTLWKSTYMRASGASELRKIWHFYIIKVLFLSIWMGRNNHLQIKILKHIFKNAYSTIFVGSRVFTHARYWQIKKSVCMIFFLCVWGAPRICGGHVPPPPPPPVATPLGLHDWESWSYPLRHYKEVPRPPLKMIPFSRVFRASGTASNDSDPPPPESTAAEFEFSPSESN